MYTRDVLGSSSGTSLTTSVPSQVPFSFRLFRFFVPPKFPYFPFLFRIFYLFCSFFSVLCRFFSRVEFGHIMWATGAGCGFLSDCNVIGESLFGADKSMLRKHWKNPKRRKVENWVLENRVWAPQISVYPVYGNPPNGPSKNLHRALRSPFRVYVSKVPKISLRLGDCALATA